jgi:8-oxo-dGTP diphosphatase
VLAITDAAARGEQTLLARLDAALERGLRMVMVREKQMPEGRRRMLTEEILTRCRRRGAIVVLNSDVASVTNVADGVHLTAAALMRLSERPGSSGIPLWWGASCHDERELARAAELQLDYVVLGPVQPTESHPAAEPMGWERFAQLVQGYPLPVYALGGMRLGDLATACTAGAHGVAMIRGAWSPAPDQSFPSDWPGSGSVSPSA